MKKLFLVLLIFPQLAFAQLFSRPDYPQDYFSSPLHIPILLAGNYGELRPGHFHEGLDIKTKGVIGYRVYAAADGYISRVAVSHTGFGHVIYIDHPDGYTTVYGHLHEFAPNLAKYVKQKQYEQESWNINLYLQPGRFPVKKGQFIALSGSTGSAAGPHVHFEIRDTKSEHPLNGQLFGFAIKDNVPPRVYRIALYDRNKSIYEQKPQTYTLHTSGGHYQPSPYKITVHTNKLGFGVQAVDRQNDTHNIFGIYEEVLYEDDKPQIGFQLDDIGYQKTRYVDAHYDYKSYKETRRHYQLLFSLPGNKLPIYYPFEGDGTIDLSDGKVHHIKIVVKDAAGNTSVIRFDVQKNIDSKPEVDLCANRMYPNTRNIFENNNIQFYLEPGTLYDEICFRYREIKSTQDGYYSDIYRLHSSDVPLYKPFTLRIKPNKQIPASLLNKLVIVRTDDDGKNEDVAAAKLDNGWVEASVGAFGEFSVQTDEVPPVITALNIHDGADLSKASTISFRIHDSKSGIKSYRAELDGNWLMFARKGSVIFYTFDEHCPKGDHTLKLTVTDAVGNQSVRIYHFKR